jgi:hypothetical protein
MILNLRIFSLLNSTIINLIEITLDRKRNPLEPGPINLKIKLMLETIILILIGKPAQIPKPSSFLLYLNHPKKQAKQLFLTDIIGQDQPANGLASVEMKFYAFFTGWHELTV